MNIDLYDLNVATAAAAASSNEEPSFENNTQTLNEEVAQVFSQLGRFWGGVRKQSQTAFESARKDLGQVVSQAQKELEKQFSTSSSSSSETQISDKAPESIPENEEKINVNDPATALGSPQRESTNTPSASTSNTLFSRLQNSLPPNLTPASLSGTLQRHLPENLQHGLNLEKATTDFAQLRATLVDNVQRVQSGTTIQQAEKLAEQYLQRGEALFKEAGFFLKDAIKVLPPGEEGEGSDTPGIIWDGTDFWPTPPSTSGSTLRKGKGKEGGMTPGALRSSVGRRTEIVLRKLRTDPDEIRKNPEEESHPELWLLFTKEMEDSGGINGRTWAEKVEAVTQSNDEDIKHLLNAHTQLVPSEVTHELFWTRYFFRVAQIQQEEERRKALLEETYKQGDDEDDFTWEVEDEEEEKNETDLKSSTETAKIANVEAAAVTTTLVPSPSIQTPSVSPRRSEDSYDVVSSNVSSTGQKSPEDAPKPKGANTNEEDDSDWE